MSHATLVAQLNVVCSNVWCTVLAANIHATLPLATGRGAQCPSPEPSLSLKLRCNLWWKRRKDLCRIKKMKEKWDHVNVSPVLKHLVSTMFINLISFYFTIQPSPVLCSLLAVTTMEQWSMVTFSPSPPAERSCGRVLAWLQNRVIQGNRGCRVWFLTASLGL